MWYTTIATKRPLGPQTEARLRRKNKIILHTMVGSLWGTDAYFRNLGYTGTESHFGVGGDGDTLQWQDDEYEADAQLEGNDDCVSVETADHGDEFDDWDTSRDDVPPWTDAQIEAIAQIIAAVAVRHDIPITLIDDTRDDTRGIGYHRQGVDPYRRHGERYSNAYGKVCPGRRRIKQIPQVIARAREIAAGTDRAPPVEDWFDMADDNDLKRVMTETLEEYETSVAGRQAHLQSLILALRGNDGLSVELREELMKVQHAAIAEAARLAAERVGPFGRHYADNQKMLLLNSGLDNAVARAVHDKPVPRSIVDGESLALAVARVRRVLDLVLDMLAEQRGVDRATLDAKLAEAEAADAESQ